MHASYGRRSVAAPMIARFSRIWASSELEGGRADGMGLPSASEERCAVRQCNPRVAASARAPTPIPPEGWSGFETLLSERSCLSVGDHYGHDGILLEADDITTGDEDLLHERAFLIFHLELLGRHVLAL